jgi:4-amino-4-deoxy-L-arabinose transferase-like glycosyltransferase
VRTRGALIDALAAVAPALVLVPIALVRFLDGDEGVYAYASRLAIHGKLPYRDFFYEQMPLVPYVYGAWTAVAGESWYTLRILSALLAAGCGALVYVAALRRAGRPAALLGAMLYATSALVFGYLTIVKTFALAAVLILAAFVLAERADVSARRWFAVGVLAALSVDARLVFLAALPVFVALARRRLAPLAAGFAVGVAPAVFFLALAPRQFVWDNLGYHLAKGSHGLGDDLVQKLHVAANLVGFGAADHYAGIQLALLVVATAAVALTHRRISPALWVAILLGAGCFAVTPTYAQYFCVVVPFLVLGIVDARPRGAVLALAALGVAAYAVAAVVDVPRQRAGDPVLKPSIPSVRAVAARVDRLSRPGEDVLSSWPGYLIGTHAHAFQGYSNQFAPVAASKVSPAKRRLYRVASERELEELIRARVPRLVVYRNWVTSPPFARWDDALRAGRYRRVATVETAAIYVR